MEDHGKHERGGLPLRQAIKVDDLDVAIGVSLRVPGHGATGDRVFRGEGAMRLTLTASAIGISAVANDGRRRSR